ncbi:MAG: hypothetical protein WA628_15110 [Terriglobales bacterium]
MKKQSLFVLAAVLCVGLGLVAASSRGLRGALNVKQADAAYRDGAYQAKIDVDSGRKPHFSSGRWSTDQDRASFIAGYEQSYRTLAEARSGKLEPTAPELAGHRDGVLDGARHRRASQPFQVSKTENYRKAGGYADANTSSDQQYYRDAYSNGYQEGYYLPQESAELRTISQK